MASYKIDDRGDTILAYLSFAPNMQWGLDIIQIGQMMELVRINYFAIYDELESKGVIKQNLKKFAKDFEISLNSYLDPIYEHCKSVDKAIAFAELAIELSDAFESEELIPSRLRLMELLIENVNEDFLKYDHIRSFKIAHKLPRILSQFMKFKGRLPQMYLPDRKESMERVREVIYGLQSQNKWLFRYFNVTEII